MTVKVGFFGAGFIADFHRGLLQESVEGHRITAVHDPDRARAEEFAERTGATPVQTEAEVFEAADAVFVCTWTSEHGRLVEEAAARGRAVFCEKPLAFDLAGAAGMTAAVEEAGVVNQVGLILRALPSFRLLRHLVSEPDNGRVMSVIFRDDQFLPVQGHYRSTWRADPSRAGSGTLLEHSIHDLDILGWLLSPVVSVTGRSAEFHGLPGIEDVVVAGLTFQSGALGSLTSVWHDVLERPSLRWVEIFCERAYFALEGDLSGPLRWTRENGDSGSVEGAALGRAADDAGVGWENPATRFIEAVRSGEPTFPDFTTALEAHAVADAIYRSSRGDGSPCDVRDEVARSTGD